MMMQEPLNERLNTFLSNSSGIWVHDIEADNLWHGITKVHCVWVIDAITGSAIGFRSHEIEECLKLLETAKVLIAHNGVDYDEPALRKLYPWFTPPNMFDTLVLARMLEPDRIQGHSLDSWGKTLGVFKDDFGKTADWSTYTEEMFEYCFQDVKVNVTLYLHLCNLAGFDPNNPPFSKIY